MEQMEHLIINKEAFYKKHGVQEDGINDVIRLIKKNGDSLIYGIGDYPVSYSIAKKNIPLYGEEDLIGTLSEISKSRYDKIMNEKD